MNKISSALKKFNRHDLILKIIKASLNFKTGEYIKQKLSNKTNYGYILTSLKNKGFKAIVIDDDRKKAVQMSVSENWSPLPTKIKESEVPPKLLAKIKAKI